MTEFHADAPAFDETGPTLASLAKKWGKLPVFANGNLNTPELAEQVIAKDQIDVVAVGKAALPNKDWALKAFNQEKLKGFNAENFFVPNAKIKDFEL